MQEVNYLLLRKKIKKEENFSIIFLLVTEDFHVV